MRTLKNILLSALFVSLILMNLNSSASIIVTTTNLESRKEVEKYSLKNLSALSHKTASFASLKSSLQFKGFSTTNSIYNLNTAAYLKYNKGNISYVIPYHYKVILPKFKTPSAQ